METKPQIFLCYADEDKDKVENLYQKLEDEGFKPWMAPKDILGGEKWERSLKEAIRCSDFFIACLSTNSVTKRGVLRGEIKQALDIWEEKLDSDIYLIPVRLECCEVPENLRQFQYVDLFEKDGWAKLVRSIRAQMKRQAFMKAEQPQTDSIKWHKSGNLFWASNDLMLALQRISQGERKDAIIYALQQSLHHIRELGFDASHPIESKLNKLLAKADRTSPEDWAEDKIQKHYIDELEPLKNALGDLASESQPDFDRGPKTYQLVIPLHD